MMGYNEKLAKIERLVPDKNLRNLIFNFDDDYSDFLTDERSCLSYFSNLLVVVANTVLNAFLQWKTASDGQSSAHADGGGFSNSMSRLYNMLDRAYDPIKFNSDFIDDLIINLDIDYLLDTDISTSFVESIGISGFFNFPRRNNRLSKYIYYLKQKRVSSRFVCDFGVEQLCECLRIFPFLCDCTMNYEARTFGDTELLGVVIDTTECPDCPYDAIDLKYSICIKNKTAYYVEDFRFDDAKVFERNPTKEQSVTLNYVPLEGLDSLKLMLRNGVEGAEKINEAEYCLHNTSIIERFLLDYDIINISLLGKDTNSVFFKDYILLNNRYIKELALTIADTITIKTKQEIKKKYEAKYAGIFDTMYVTSLYSGNDTENYRWDEIVLFFLLEEGIYNFLCFLLQHEKFNAFMYSFNRRFGQSRIEAICRAEPFIENPEMNVQYSTSVKGIIDRQAKAIILLASRLLTLNEWNLEKSYYPTTVDDIIIEFDRVNSSAKYRDEEKVLYFVNTVLRVVLFVNTFYHGIFRYAYCKKRSILELEGKGLYYSNYKKYNKAKDAWILEMKEEIGNNRHGNLCVGADSQKWLYTQSSIDDITSKLEAAFSLLTETNARLGSRYNNNNEMLFDSLGKQSLFVAEDMLEFKQRILEALKETTRSLLPNLYSTIRSFLLYLKTGNASGACVDDASYVIENAIYPIVGQYYCGVTSRDGYRYSYFKVSSSGDNLDDGSLDIKMITDDEFDFGYSYYCVPNINRVASVGQEGRKGRIWVSPIIVPCSVFLPQLASQIETLDNVNDYDQAVELIYNSDTFIYDQLFGSLENAKIVMPALFESKKSKFYKKYYYVIKQDEQVVAISSLYKSSDFKWDTDIVRKAFEDCGVDLPETFDSAVGYLKDIFNDCIGSSFCLIDDLCVRNDCRSRGIGKSLILYLSKKLETEGYSIILSVYCQNAIAYNLHSSIGFIPYSNNKEEIKTGKKYLMMIKK